MMKELITSVVCEMKEKDGTEMKTKRRNSSIASWQKTASQIDTLCPALTLHNFGRERILQLKTRRIICIIY
jgi:hypothetical protein